MATTLGQLMALQTPENQAKIIARSDEMVAEIEGRKDDMEKPMMDLIPPNMELEVARVLTFGAVKYGRNNWRNVEDSRNRYMAALRRHTNAMSRGQVHDEVSGLLHSAHAICCLMFIGELDIYEIALGEGL